MLSVDVFYSAVGAGVGAAGSVFVVFRVFMAAMKEDIHEVKETANKAHARLDRHLESHH